MYFIEFCLGGRKSYDSWLQDPNTTLPAILDLLPGVWFAALLIACRIVFNSAFRQTAQGWASGNGTQTGTRAQKLLEEVWVTAGGCVLLIWAWHATQSSDPACRLFNMGECIRGWPVRVVSPPEAKHYYWAELGWYIHLTLKHVLGYGLRDGGDMHLHHAATLVLIVLSYTLNGAHVGAYIMALLNASNPLLHASKLANEQGWAQARVFTFALFAAVFFVTRVVVFPLSVLRFSLMQSVHVLHDVWQDVVPLYVAFNALLLLLYLLQIQWMAGIFRILRRAFGTGGFEAAGKFSSTVDPTVRRMRDRHKLSKEQQRQGASVRPPGSIGSEAE